jgi:hypothetical protein
MASKLTMEIFLSRFQRDPAGRRRTRQFDGHYAISPVDSRRGAPKSFQKNIKRYKYRAYGAFPLQRWHSVHSGKPASFNNSVSRRIILGAAPVRRFHPVKVKFGSPVPETP